MRTLVRRFGSPLAAVGTGLLMVLTLAPGNAVARENVTTPGNLTGYGFDQCLAPEQWEMNRWLNHSPFLAVGIYISGDSRGCRSQPNLTTRWISTQLEKGWRLLPITLGPQASCSPHFPRYDDDETIDPTPGPSDGYPDARRQGRAEGRKTVRAAAALGISEGSTMWYDLEGFDHTQTRCRESALRFLSGWVTKVSALGYHTGVYSSAASGIVMLDRALAAGRNFAYPDYIWIARWDGVANTSTSYISDERWNPHRRVKQYEGGHNETWGGVTINIDRNYLDVGRGTVAPKRVKHCGGVRINWWNYKRLTPGNAQPSRVKTLQCLLKIKRPVRRADPRPLRRRHNPGRQQVATSGGRDPVGDVDDQQLGHAALGRKHARGQDRLRQLRRTTAATDAQRRARQPRRACHRCLRPRDQACAAGLAGACRASANRNSRREHLGSAPALTDLRSRASGCCGGCAPVRRGRGLP